MEITYKEFIQNILDTRGRFACDKEYHERHHIIPKCMDGTDGKDNLIDLFAREHFEAHRLLALENPNNNKLVYAWWAMAHLKDKNQDRVELLAEEYEEAKKAYSKMCSEKYAGENNPNYGRRHTEEERQKISQSRLGKYTGEDNPFYGKKHTEETRKKMSENSTTKKKVMCLEVGYIFDSITEAAEFANVSKYAISNCCKGKSKTSGGYHWKYYEEVKEVA